MNYFLNFINKIRTNLIGTSSNEDSTIYSLATRSAINRRKNTRVNYPDIGAVGGLPIISHKSKVLTVRDISTGGICIVDDSNIIGEIVGRVYELSLQWDDGKTLVNGQVVGSNLDKRHIQFTNLDPRGFVKLSLLLKPGFIGSKFRKIQSLNQELIDATEMWVGPTGESLVFLVDDLTLSMGELARVYFADKEISVFRNSPALYSKSGKSFTAGQKVSSAFMNDVHVLIANIINPSIKVKQLIEHLHQANYD